MRIKQISVLAALFLTSLLSACSSIEVADSNEPKVAVEQRYTTGSMIPQKKPRKSNDVKTVSGDDINTMPRAITPTDPLGGR